MSGREFDAELEAHVVRWRQLQGLGGEQGTQNGREYPWIVPPARWEEGLYPGLRAGGADSLEPYLKSQGIQKHLGVHNLKSSWVACANLYFPFRKDVASRALLAGFLRAAVSEQIDSVDGVELEYAEDGELHPSRLLGEEGGNRGAGQTSPDVAFLLNGGRGVILTESKLSEHSFYDCSARTTTGSTKRPGNPDPARCKDIAAVLASPGTQCHQVEWGRRYWERLGGAVDRDAVMGLKACPAAVAGYQLFRQQALAEGYTTKYPLAVSAVAYDERNQALIRSLKLVGISPFPEGWAALFKGKATFRAWTHQMWVSWVRERDTAGEWRGWADWIGERYGYLG